MIINLTLEQALLKASPRLRKQIQWSVDLLRKSEALALKYDADNGFWVGFSGGKDSQALLHIVQLAGVKHNSYFSPTSVDPPQLIRFIRTRYPEVGFTPLKESIYDVFRRTKVLPDQRIRWCCAVFKEKGGENKVTLTGVRKEESARRSKRNEVEVSRRKFSGNLDEFEDYSARVIKRKFKNLNQDEFSDAKESEVRCINGKDKIIINPIINWTERDVWEFLNNVIEVPHCELYDEPYNQHRIGCIMCPMASTKNIIEQMNMFPHVREKWIQAIMDVRKATFKEGESAPPAKVALPTNLAKTCTWSCRIADPIATRLLRGGGQSKITQCDSGATKSISNPIKSTASSSQDNVNFQIAPMMIARLLVLYMTSKQSVRLLNI